jgi:hypothetical protein
VRPWAITVNCKLRDELVNGEIFYSMKEAQVIIEQWQKRHCQSKLARRGRGW